MADEGNKRMKSIGVIPISKLTSLKEFKAWQEASEKFSAAKEASKVAKAKLRDVLKRHSSALKNVENVDFLMASNGKDLNIYQINRSPTTRKRNVDELEFA